MLSRKREMHEDLTLGFNPERPSVNEMTSKFYTAEHDICDGQVKLLRTKQSGDVWQMRCWISAEKQYVKNHSEQGTWNKQKKKEENSIIR